MRNKLIVIFTKILVFVISHLSAPDAVINVTLNPILWALQFGIYFGYNDLHEGKYILIILPMGRIRLDYADAGIISHMIWHQIADRVERNWLKPGETMESAGFGEFVPKDCDHVGM